MTRYWLAGVAAFALMTGGALAQTSSDTTTSTTLTQSTTTTAAPAAGTYSATKTKQSVDSNGIQTDKSKTYKSGPAGTKTTSAKQTTSADGSQKITTHKARIVTPTGATSDSATTTTSVVRP